MGHDRRINGDAGEGLFQYLACFYWRAEVLPHPSAQGTDAYIGWHDLNSVERLPIQVKSRRALPPRAKEFKLELEPAEIGGWAARRPILVLCDLSVGRAWWHDTKNDHLPSNPKASTTLRIPLVNLIDATTRDPIRNIAVQRWRESTHYPSLPARLTGVKQDTLEHVIQDAYAEIRKMEFLDRDVVALSVARLLERSRCVDHPSDLNNIMMPMIDRIGCAEQGGRSHSLAALLSLLLLGSQRDELRTDLRADLSRVAKFAVTSGDFVHPEFGLIIAARLAEAGKPRDFECFKDLLEKAASMNQTERFREVARNLALWEPAEQPLWAVLGPRRLGAQISRWSNEASQPFNRQEQAEDAVARAIDCGAAALTSEDLQLIDHWTRYRADQFLRHDLGRYLFG